MTGLWLTVAFLTAVVSLAGCAAPQSAVEKQLTQNEQKWDSQKIRDYSYTLRIGCF